MREQPEIRTREKVHNIKSLNRASVLSQRLKTCFIRSKQNAENVGETKQASCSLGVQWFKEHDQWKSSTYTPKIGDIIFFDWDHDGGPDHVGIVESVSDGYVHTVEGNSGDACRQQQYSLSSSDIFGYGVPAY